MAPAARWVDGTTQVSCKTTQLSRKNYAKYECVQEVMSTVGKDHSAKTKVAPFYVLEVSN